jgi:hypothetical protein
MCSNNVGGSVRRDVRPKGMDFTASPRALFAAILCWRPLVGVSPMVPLYAQHATAAFPAKAAFRDLRDLLRLLYLERYQYRSQPLRLPISITSLRYTCLRAYD